MQGCDWRLRRSIYEKWDLMAITGECRPFAIESAMKIESRVRTPASKMNGAPEKLETGAGKWTGIVESGNGFI